jgi:hypothetical protein
MEAARMASETPIVRYFVPCLEIVVAPDRRDVTLRSLIHTIARLPGEPFPCLRERMALYALLANGRGEHDFAVELVYFQGGHEQARRRPGRRIDLGQDPAVVHGLPIPMRNVTFDQHGQYTFYLLCDVRRIAEAHVDVR